MSLGGFTPSLDRATRLAILQVQRYFTTITDAISAAVTALDSAKVDRAGDTMTGDLNITATQEILDTDGRRFMRTDTARTNAQCIEYARVSGTTDASGKIYITFPEAFTATPVVVSVRSELATSNLRTSQQEAVSTTGFSARFFNGGTVLGAGTSVTLDYVAMGPKTDF